MNSNLPSPSPTMSLSGQQPKQSDWEVLGETFDAMGKVGLAMTVGFTVAAAFCKLVDSGKLKIPKPDSLVQMVLNQETPASRNATPTQT